jgi:predicted DCC family thiol-disulfide oxidoreductase YuxK
MSTGPVLIYDGDCKFCQLSLEFGIRHLDYFPNYVAFQRIDPAAFSLTKDQVRSQIWLVQPQSTSQKPLGGHLAAGSILRMQKSWILRSLGWLTVTPPTSWLASIGYRFIAANRHRLPGGTRECKLTDTYPIKYPPANK